MRRVRQREVNDQLKKIGFGGLDDPELFKQMAFCIGYTESTLRGKHDHFRKVLLSVEPHLRTVAYESVRPHLNFTPKALDEYIIDGKREAEELQLSVQMPDGTFVSYRDFHGGSTPGPSIEDMAEAAINAVNSPVLSVDPLKEGGKGTLTLRCGKCTKEVSIECADKLQGYSIAKSKGWVFTLFENRKTHEKQERPICSTCPAIRVTVKSKLIQ